MQSETEIVRISATAAQSFTAAHLEPREGTVQVPRNDAAREEGRWREREADVHERRQIEADAEEDVPRCL